MRRTAAAAAVILALFSLAGCSWFGKDDDKPAEVAIVDRHVPVESVRSIEIGRTRDGISVTAFGQAPGLGYAMPELRPRRDGRPGPDGLLDFDFVAQPPDPGFNMGTGERKARAIRADLLLAPQDLEGVRGIRVHGASGGLQVQF